MVYLIVVVYLLVLALGFFFQRSLIFYPGELESDYPFDLAGGARELFVETVDGENINAIYYPGHLPLAVLYLHGNAGDLNSWQHVSLDFTRRGYHFFIVDYRGYGKSTGVISEKGFYHDAEAAFRYVSSDLGIPADRIIIYGRSIGTGPAVELATRHRAKGLVLEAPFSSLVKLANQKLPFLLPALTLRFRFNNLSKINRVECPILFIHGSDDRLIPPAHSRLLYDRFAGRKELILIDKGTHNDLSVFPEYQKALINTFPKLFK